MLAYFVADNHVDLYPWNNLTTPQLASTLGGVIPFSIYAVAFALSIRWLLVVDTVHSYVWLGCRSGNCSRRRCPWTRICGGVLVVMCRSDPSRSTIAFSSSGSVAIK